MKEKCRQEQSGAKRRSGAKNAERVQSKNNLQKQIVAFQILRHKKLCNMNKAGRQNRGKEGKATGDSKEQKKSVKKGAREAGQARKQRRRQEGHGWGMVLWHGAEPGGVKGGVNLLNMLDLRGGASRRNIVNSGYY